MFRPPHDIYTLGIDLPESPQVIDEGVGDDVSEGDVVGDEESAAEEVGIEVGEEGRGVEGVADFDPGTDLSVVDLIGT